MRSADLGSVSSSLVTREGDFAVAIDVRGIESLHHSADECLAGSGGAFVLCTSRQGIICCQRKRDRRWGKGKLETHFPFSLLSLTSIFVRGKLSLPSGELPHSALQNFDSLGRSKGEKEGEKTPVCSGG